MLAAAAAAQWGDPAPEDLTDAWDCQRYNVPYDGPSLMDQPAGKTFRMNTALNIFDAFDSRQRAMLTGMDMQEWSEKNPRAWKIVAHIERIRFDNSR
ncbi:MAG: hypothetical protein GWN94_22585 [Phycisphaerae bacterium]|nr:hypothetical protein [Phycisphaerae bacterium]NIS53850.1 hypothetical protein [Phycisphaerae bacterium]